MDEVLFPALIEPVRVLYLHHNLTLKAPYLFPVTSFLFPVNPEEDPCHEKCGYRAAGDDVVDRVRTHFAGSVSQLAFHVLLWVRIARLVRSSIDRMSASVTRIGFTQLQAVSTTTVLFVEPVFAQLVINIVARHASNGFLNI